LTAGVFSDKQLPNSGRGTIVIIIAGKGTPLNQFQLFFIRAILAAVFAVIITRVFRGHTDLPYVIGLAIILLGLAYFAEYLRRRKRR
jgi:hypothetical protein